MALIRRAHPQIRGLAGLEDHVRQCRHINPRATLGDIAVLDRQITEVRRSGRVIEMNLSVRHILHEQIEIRRAACAESSGSVRMTSAARSPFTG